MAPVQAPLPLFKKQSQKGHRYDTCNDCFGEAFRPYGYKERRDSGKEIMAVNRYVASFFLEQAFKNKGTQYTNRYVFQPTQHDVRKFDFLHEQERNDSRKPGDQCTAGYKQKHMNSRHSVITPIVATTKVATNTAK